MVQDFSENFEKIEESENFCFKILNNSKIIVLKKTLAVKILKNYLISVINAGFFLYYYNFNVFQTRSLQNSVQLISTI